MEGRDVLFASGSEEWATPNDFFDHYLARLWGPFDLDPAATAENTKADAFYTADDDGLARPWYGRVFVNPPFNRRRKMSVGPWVKKAVEEVEAGHANLVCMLLPSRTDTKWWHDYVMRKASAVHLVRGRLCFVQDGGRGGKRQPAPFPSAVVIFAPGATNPAFASMPQA